MRMSAGAVVMLAVCGAATVLGAGQATIVAFGDSTTATRGKLKIYANVLQEELPAKGLPVKVVNAGVGGNNTEHGRKRFERDVLAHKPDLVIIQFGINDSAVDVSRGSTEPRVAMGTYATNLRLFIRALKKARARVILMTPNPLRWTPKLKELYGKPPYKPDDPRGFNVLLTRYAAAARKVGKAERVPVLDVFAAFERYGKASSKSVDDLLLDGMHPNDKGHQIVSGMLVPQILKMMKGARRRGK